MYSIGRTLAVATLRQTWQKLPVAAMAGVLLVAVVVPGGPVLARSATNLTVALAQLPPEAQATYQAVLSGGPFAYSKDGIVFGNREHQLPPKGKAHYREYTVKTPGSRDRGARRIVCGGKPPTQPEACFYTDDHYANFRRIVQ